VKGKKTLEELPWLNLCSCTYPLRCQPFFLVFDWDDHVEDLPKMNFMPPLFISCIGKAYILIYTNKILVALGYAFHNLTLHPAYYICEINEPTRCSRVHILL